MQAVTYTERPPSAEPRAPVSYGRSRRETWCREGDLNPHNPFGSADFKSAASASFAIPARKWLLAQSRIAGELSPNQVPTCGIATRDLALQWRGWPAWSCTSPGQRRHKAGPE